jgi:hypothetical protein
MRVLFAISVVALAALLWASIAIVQHVNKVRQTRKLHRSKLATKSQQDLANQP